MKPILVVAGIAVLGGHCFAAAPSTNFLEVVKCYADAMIAHGRDMYGPQKSGLLLSALDRLTLKPLTVRPAAPGGIRRGDRPGRPWSAMNGANPQLAMICVSRYENTGNIAYRDLVHAAADADLKSMPAPDADVWPMTLGHAVSLQVAEWRSTARQVYLDRAREFADFAVNFSSIRAHCRALV